MATVPVCLLLYTLIIATVNYGLYKDLFAANLGNNRLKDSLNCEVLLSPTSGCYSIRAGAIDVIDFLIHSKLHCNQIYLPERQAPLNTFNTNKSNIYQIHDGTYPPFVKY